MFTFLINDGTVDAKYVKMIDLTDNYFMKVIFYHKQIVLGGKVGYFAKFGTNYKSVLYLQITYDLMHT